MNEVKSFPFRYLRTKSCIQGIKILCVSQNVRNKFDLNATSTNLINIWNKA